MPNFLNPCIIYSTVALILIVLGLAALGGLFYLAIARQEIGTTASHILWGLGVVGVVGALWIWILFKYGVWFVPCTS